MKLFVFTILSTMLIVSFAAEIGSDFREKIVPHIRACREELNLSLDFVKSLKEADFGGDLNKAKVRYSILFKLGCFIVIISST